MIKSKWLRHARDARFWIEYAMRAGRTDAQSLSELERALSNLLLAIEELKTKETKET